jgi:hypothetical protein
MANDQRNDNNFFVEYLPTFLGYSTVKNNPAASILSTIEFNHISKNMGRTSSIASLL